MIRFVPQPWMVPKNSYPGICQYIRQTRSQENFRANDYKINMFFAAKASDRLMIIPLKFHRRFLPISLFRDCLAEYKVA